MLDVLVISPHPDDAELGMAGSILKMQSEGWAVGVLDLTSGEPTPFGTPEIRARETAAATKVLGLDWRENLGLPNRSLEPTLEARARVAEVIRRERPRWLFAPYWVDAHPDHVAATQLIEAARFWAKLTKTDLAGQPHYPERIYYYYCVHLRLVPQPAFILDISEFWEKKLAALQCYRSQLIEGRGVARPESRGVARPESSTGVAGNATAAITPVEDSGRATRPPTLLDQLRDQAATWGWAIGARYGEPFASREPVGLTTLSALR